MNMAIILRTKPIKVANSKTATEADGKILLRD
jgi:hypothetical protein